MSDTSAPLRSRAPATIVLTAGASRRMGARNKLLLPFRGKPLAAHVVEAAQAATGGDVLVVTGHERERVEAMLGDCAVRFAHNSDYESGMASSLRCGIKAAPAGASSYLVCLGDQPRVTAEALGRLCEHFHAAGDSAAIVTFEDVPGPPVLFGSGHRAALLDLPDGDHGAKALLQERAGDVIRVPPGEAGLSAEALSDDIDTPGAYRRLQEEG